MDKKEKVMTQLTQAKTSAKRKFFRKNKTSDSEASNKYMTDLYCSECELSDSNNAISSGQKCLKCGNVLGSTTRADKTKTESKSCCQNTGGKLCCLCENRPLCLIIALSLANFHIYMFILLNFSLSFVHGANKLFLSINTLRLRVASVYLSRIVRKPALCICENKDADQLRGNREADQRLCCRYLDSTIPLLPKSEIVSFLTSSVAVQPGLCLTWSETSKTGFLTTRLICLFNDADTPMQYTVIFMDVQTTLMISDEKES